MKQVNLLLICILTVLTVSFTAYAGSLEIAECGQDIEKNCIRLKVNASDEYKYISAIACEASVSSDMPADDIAELIISAAQIKRTASENIVELFYDEANIKNDKLYIYVSSDGAENASAVIPFMTRDERIVLSFKESAVWNEYAELIEKYNEAFGIFDLDEVLRVRLLDLNTISRADIYKRMYKERNSFSSVSDIEKSYISAVKYVYEASRVSGSGGGSGGSVPGFGFTYINGNENAQPASDDELKTFTDMEGYSWAAEAVSELKKRNIAEGTAEGKFNPGGIITREDFVKIFVSAAKYELSNEKSFFSDIVEGAYYEKYVSAAYDKGIINGISDSEFGIGMPITRQDMAVILYRAAFRDKIEKGQAYNFKDHDTISAYAKEAVSDLAAEGIISGMDDGSFRPLEYASRAQAAYMIYKLLISGKI